MSDFEGREIVAMRPMTTEERKREGWMGRGIAPPVIELDDGTTLFPSRDAEGNGPGALFGINPDGEGFAVIPEHLNDD